MERERGFNFRLLVPPRSNAGQVSAVKPRDIFDDPGNCGFDKGFNKCYEKEPSMPFTSTGMPVTLPTKANKTDISKKIAVMPMEKEETPVKPSQLYSKLFEEAEKIKCWKSKLDSEISQKDRKLHENKRTIETQRKAIQELQFENESLSMKLEEQMNDNTDLRNKNNATRNLCNILKDTFERSAEKMSLFEAEKEETQHLFVQNSETIQRMIDAFEGLRIQAEHDQQEMSKAKEGLKQFEHLKETFEKEFSLKEEEVVSLQTKLENKESELKEVSASLQETQVTCNQLSQAEAQCQEALQTCRQQQEILTQKLQGTEVLLKESEEKASAMASTLELTKQEHEKSIAEKVAKLENLITIQNQQANQFSELQQTTGALRESVAAEKQRAEELESKGSLVSEELNQKNAELGKITEQKEEADKQIKVLEAKLEQRSALIMTLEKQVEAKEDKISELTTEIEKMNDEITQLQCKVTTIFDECEDVKTSFEKAQNEERYLKDMTQALEAKLKECEEQLSAARRQEEESEKEIDRLKKDSEQHQKECERLTENVNHLMTQKNTIQQQMEEITSETRALEGFVKESKENEETIKNEVVRLEDENQEVKEQLKTLHTKFEDQCQQTKELQKKLSECSKTSQNESTKKDKQAKALEVKLNTLTTKLENKTKAHEEIQKENKSLLKQISASKEDTSQLQTEINELRENAQRAQRCHEEELQRLNSDLSTKADTEAELREEVGKLKEAATKALESKEDAEIKCQHKISDMVALMDKHKNQYDKMVMEKDSELEERIKRSMEISASKTKLELELSQLQIENGHMKQHLNIEKKETERLHQEVEELKKTLRSQKKDHEQIEENLEKDILDLKKQMKSLTEERQVISETKGPLLVRKVQRGLSTPKVYSAKKSTFALTEVEEDPFFATPSRRKATDVFDIPQANTKDVFQTPSKTPANKIGSTPKNKTNTKDAFQTPSRTPASKIGSTPQIKAFRIRTPPSNEKWQKATLELEPKSDTSDGADPLEFPGELEHITPRCFAPPLRETVAQNKKTPSPAVQKQAAIKRMRDAGWTTLATLNRKKKKDSEKIFA